MILLLSKIAKDRLENLKYKEKELLKINNTEEYGESKYFTDTEMTAIGISSIEELLDHFEKNKIIWNK